MKKNKLLIMVTILCAILFSTKMVYKAEAKFDLSDTSQNIFNDFCEEISPVFTYKSFGIAAPLGILGFEACLEANGATIDSDIINDILNDAPSMVFIPRLAVRKGLPFKIDIGAIYSPMEIEDESFNLTGFEIKYSIIEGSAVLPAVSVRGNYLALNGIDDFDVSSFGADVLISKGLGVDILFKLVPYGGLSYNNITITPNNIFDLDEVKSNALSLFLGLRLSLSMTKWNIKLDYDQKTNNMNYGLSVGIGF